MTDQLLTICIPTANRPALARKTVKAILDTKIPGVEILILENSAAPELSAADFGNNPSVIISRSDRPISMPENWERGISQASGKYLAYFSDKDIVVPDALEQALTVLANKLPTVLCYRKAVFQSEFQRIHHYQCRGGTQETATAPLLRSWYDHIRHIHSAPMIYNSFVSSDFVKDMRTRGGRFFIGTSPDVCSGMLIAAYLPAYLQLDLMVSVSFSGNWSNGLNAIRHGMPKEFVKAFANDPFAHYGLPETIASSVLEVLLSLTEAHPKAFAGGRIDWKKYVEVVYKEVSGTTRSVAEKRRELRRVLGPRSVVPAYYKLEKIGKLTARHVLPIDFFKKIAAFQGRVAKMAQRSPESLADETPRNIPPWDDDNYRFVSDAKSIDEGLRVAAANNRRASITAEVNAVLA